MKTMNYVEALEYISSVSSLGSRPGLSRITELMHRLGDVQNRLKFVHVAGTNGKGSFCAMLEAVLRSAGNKTGLFTSPHIERINERIRVNGRDIDDETFADVTSRVAEAAEDMQDRPTEFELLTAMAFLAFYDAKCDVAVLECGMGGRYDATNVINTTVLSVITGVSLDHTHILGNTVEEIAKEKSGIIKRATPVLYGGNSASALSVIKKDTADADAKLFITDRNALRDFEYGICGSSFTYKDKKYGISLAGSYQPYNAANVIEAVEILRGEGFCIPETALTYGLANTTWHARFELIRRDPVVIYDGGHNPEGAQAVVDSVTECLGGKCVIVSGVLADKDHLGIAMDLADVAVRAYTVTPESSRALDAEHWADDLRIYGIPSVACRNFSEAVKKAVDFARENALPVVVTGSLYMYNDFKTAILST